MVDDSLVLYDAPTRELQGSDQHWGTADMRVTVTAHTEFQSTNNSWPKRRRKGTITNDVGSNWTCFKSDIEMSPLMLDVQCHLSGGTYHGYQGPVLAGHHRNNFDAEDFFELPLGYSSEPDLIGLGTTAISRCIPTNPISDLPTAVGELLSEGLPGLPGRGLTPRRFTRNSIPGEYLGYEFGLKPFLSDLAKFRTAVLEAEKLIQGYVRNAGQPIRRRYEFPREDSVETFLYQPESGYEKYLGGPCNSQIAGYLTPVLSGWPGEVTEVLTRTRKTWFAGAFVYYLPSVGDSWSSKLLAQEAYLRHLYGGLSVETAWNLLPYSWAADWFTNAGDLIHNLQAFANDGLVMPFGYVMEKCELHSYRTVRGAIIGRTYPGDTALYLPDVSTSYYTSYQRRRKATPFGFGLDVDGFTNRQKAITAALLFR